jgi:hypothetical protein
MMWDDAVSKARGECEKFLSMSEAEQSMEALKPVLKTIDLVLASMNFYSAMDKRLGAGVRVHWEKLHIGAGLYDHFRVFYKQDGTFVEVHTLGNKDESSVFDQKIYEKQPTGSDISLKKVVENLVRYLDDPTSGLDKTASKLKN